MSRFRDKWFVLLLLLCAGGIFAGARWLGRLAPVSLAAAASGVSYAGTQQAPAFPTGLDWINTGGKPLTLTGLHGKVVLLDFWTYGCINCFHIIPDLRKLEHKYADSLVVIGVHSAKFATERKTSHIKAIVQRYGLSHPVVNDRNMQIWNEYSVNAWPTLVIIDPAGKVVGAVAGEGHYAVLDKVIGSLQAEFAAHHGLNTRPLGFEKKAAQMPATPLLYPGKVLADAVGKRLFIADSNHNRIVVTSLRGKVEAVIGKERPGFANGDYAHARFRYPQGLALADANTLYVADTDNNAIRRVDLARHLVSTIAGTGKQEYMTGTRFTAAGAALNTPWALLYHQGALYIAMAGQHQIWRYSPHNGQLNLFAGSSAEGIDDSNRLAASFAQPSGLTTDGKVLYVADPEASAVRKVGFGTDDRVVTLVGTGLFDFGDRDGSGYDVLLQHDLGITWRAGKLYIADTYNSKVKVLDPSNRNVTTLVGGNGELDEPGGLSSTQDRLYIADTNHNSIKVYAFKSGKLATLSLLDPRKLLQ